MKLESYEPRLAGPGGQLRIRAIMETLAEGLAKGEAMTKLPERVRKVFPEGDDDACYAIASTESARISTRRDIEQWKQSGVVEKKEWSTGFDPCPYCAALAGKQVPLDAPFFDVGDEWVLGGEELMTFDERIDGPPLHPECTCYLVAVLGETGE